MDLVCGGDRGLSPGCLVVDPLRNRNDCSDHGTRVVVDPAPRGGLGLAGRCGQPGGVDRSLVGPTALVVRYLGAIRDDPWCASPEEARKALSLLTFEQVVTELSALQGKTVLFQVRATGDKFNTVFEGIDCIDRAGRIFEEDHAYVVFHDMEAGATIRPQDFTEAQWEGGWRPGEEGDPLLRIQLGQVELGVSPL
jgi:hypothetical protein